jgi:hypothetical protein
MVQEPAAGCSLYRSAVFCTAKITVWLLATNHLTNSMERGTFWDANRFSACQEIPRVLRNSMVHCRVLNSPPLVPILSQLNPYHPSFLFMEYILILSFHLCLDLICGHFPSGFPTKPHLIIVYYTFWFVLKLNSWNNHHRLRSHFRTWRTINNQQWSKPNIPILRRKNTGKPWVALNQIYLLTSRSVLIPL